VFATGRRRYRPPRGRLGRHLPLPRKPGLEDVQSPKNTGRTQVKRRYSSNVRLHWLLAVSAMLLLPHAVPQAQVRWDSKQRISVPLAGCKSDGQAGPIEAPENGTVSVGLTPTAGSNLAYYKAAFGIGILAPHAWQAVADCASTIPARSSNPARNRINASRSLYSRREIDTAVLYLRESSAASCSNC
jgi:hypothetical protein